MRRKEYPAVQVVNAELPDIFVHIDEPFLPPTQKRGEVLSIFAHQKRKSPKMEKEHVKTRKAEFADKKYNYIIQSARN